MSRWYTCTQKPQLNKYGMRGSVGRGSGFGVFIPEEPEELPPRTAYALEVRKGDGSGMYYPEDVARLVAYKAPVSSYFTEWTSSEPDRVNTPKRMVTGFIMPSKDAWAQANYEKYPESYPHGAKKEIGRIFGKGSSYITKGLGGSNSNPTLISENGAVLLCKQWSSRVRAFIWDGTSDRISKIFAAGYSDYGTLGANDYGKGWVADKQYYPVVGLQSIGGEAYASGLEHQFAAARDATFVFYYNFDKSLYQFTGDYNYVGSSGNYYIAEFMTPWGIPYGWRDNISIGSLTSDSNFLYYFLMHDGYIRYFGNGLGMDPEINLPVEGQGYEEIEGLKFIDFARGFALHETGEWYALNVFRDSEKGYSQVYVIQTNLGMDFYYDWCSECLTNGKDFYRVISRGYEKDSNYFGKIPLQGIRGDIIKASTTDMAGSDWDAHYNGNDGPDIAFLTSDGIIYQREKFGDQEYIPIITPDVFGGKKIIDFVGNPNNYTVYEYNTGNCLMTVEG